MTARTPAQTARDLIAVRQQAYRTCFKKDSPFAKEVLKDLAKFCRAQKSTFHPDARMHAMLEGRREVFLRILNLLQMTPDELYQFLGGIQ